MDLPDPARLAALREALDLVREQGRTATALCQMAAALDRASRRHAALKDLPEALPVLESLAEARETLGTLGALRQAREAAQERLGRAAAGLQAVRADMARLVEDAQGQCPTCGSSVDADGLLDRHSHHSPSVAA